MPRRLQSETISSMLYLTWSCLTTGDDDDDDDEDDEVSAASVGAVDAAKPRQIPTRRTASAPLFFWCDDDDNS